jgi:hypothetical protein
MRIREIILREDYADELVQVVQDLLVMLMNKNVKEISTDGFRKFLLKQGYDISIEEIIAVVDQSGFASSVDANKIIPANQLPDDLQQQDANTDVGKMAGDQAMKDVKGSL